MNHETFHALRSWIVSNYPYARKARLVIELPDGEQARLPITLVGPSAPGSAPSGASVPDRTWEPNAFQLGILDALAGRALRVDKLAEVIKDRPRLYRDPGGIKELERRGLVAHSKKFGYYRPDAAPEELEEIGHGER